MKDKFKDEVSALTCHLSLVTRHCSKKNSRAKQRGTSKKRLEVCDAL
jgi:hypothetical protein